MGKRKAINYYAVLCVVSWIFHDHCLALPREQLKKMGLVMKKSCMAKNDVTEDQIGSIEQGKFIETRNVMCYIACIYTMSLMVKNNKFSHEALVKQVDLLFPPDIKEEAKEASLQCRDTIKKYKDLCEQAYWGARCMYDYDAAHFFFA